MPSWKIAVALAVVLLAAASAATDAQLVGCYSFFSHGRKIDPSLWNPVVSRLAYHHPNTTTESIWWAMDLCNGRKFTVAPPSDSPNYGFLVSTPQGNQTFPKLDFDEFVDTRTEPSMVRYTYRPSRGAPAETYADVYVYCDPSAKTLQPRFDRFYSRKNANNGTTYMFELGIDQLCMNFTTAAPTGTTAPPPTTTANPVPQNKCKDFKIANRTVNPNTWAPLVDKFKLYEFNKTDVTVAIDLCDSEKFTDAPSNGSASTSGFVVINGDNNRFNFAFGYKKMVHIIDSPLFHLGIWQFSDHSADERGNYAFIYVFCNHSAGPKLEPAHNGMVKVFNNSEGGYTFYAFLQTSEMCPPPPPPQQCEPFMIENKKVNPNRFGPANAVLKDVMTGDEVTWLVDACNAHHWTTAPSDPFKPGFIVAWPKSSRGSKSNFPQVSFDDFEHAFYMRWLREYRMRYKTTQANHTGDRAELVIRCGPSPRLTFSDNYFMALKNPEGGMTYQFQMQVNSMCPTEPTHPPTSRVPPPPHPTTMAPPQPTMAPTHVTDHPHPTDAPAPAHPTTAAPSP